MRISDWSSDVCSSDRVFGLGIAAHVRMRALPGEVKRLVQLLIDTPEVIEADRVTGEDCFLAKVLVSDMRQLETVIDRFVPYSATDTAIIQSATVSRRRSEAPTSALPYLFRIPYAVFILKKKT